MEVDAKYDPDDDSEDEECIARKKAAKKKQDELNALKAEESKNLPKGGKK